MEGGPAALDRFLLDQKPQVSELPQARIDSAGFGLEPLSAVGLRDTDSANDIRLSAAYLGAKRLIDVLGALACALVFSPIIVAVTLSLARSGRVIFAHTRIGRDGRVFNVYKFRSMVVDADRVLAELLATSEEARIEWAADRKLRCDPRITRTGAFLRKTSLDELPQLWNVLKGEMSLVGPRPVVFDELEMYGRAKRYYLAVKPGITGLWQVMGRNDVNYRRRIAMDRRYARTACTWLDVLVLLKTVKVVLARSGAY
jgi:lipopolysaccharide/colanic/teichoic acid biosynthesis glycosyltransferase